MRLAVSVPMGSNGSKAFMRKVSIQRSSAPVEAPTQIAAIAFSKGTPWPRRPPLSPRIDPPLGHHDAHLRQPCRLLDACGARAGPLGGVDPLERDLAHRGREAREMFRSAVRLQGTRKVRRDD